MNIILIGLNHKTAPVEIRQHIAFDREKTAMGLKYLRQKYPSSEFVLLSTCNRVELYAACEAAKNIMPMDLAKDIAIFHGTDFEVFRDYLYVMRSDKAVRHLLTVAASLDSMVVGENQILSQVKHSYSQAVGAKTTGKILNHLFHMAFATGKKVFSRTSIASGRVSVAGVAVEHARGLFEEIRSAKIVVVGAGEMGELLIDHFQHIKCEDITVVNRTEQTGCSLASRKNVAAAPLEKLEDELCAADIVVSAVSADEGYLFEKGWFLNVAAVRGGRTMLIVDIAVPRSFEPAISELKGVHLYCIDDLSGVAEENIKLRAEDVEKAVEIICQATTEYMDWFAMLSVGPIIGQMKDAFGKIKDDEMDGFFVGCRSEANCKDAMDASVNKVVSKILHCVIKNIDHIAHKHGPDEAAEFAKNVLADAENIIDGSGKTDAAQ